MGSNEQKVDMSSLQCYSVLSDILVKNEFCIPLEMGRWKWDQIVYLLVKVSFAYFKIAVFFLFYLQKDNFV